MIFLRNSLLIIILFSSSIATLIAQPKLPADVMKIRNVALVQIVYLNESMYELTEMFQSSSPDQLKTRIPFIQAQVDSLQVIQEKVSILLEMYPNIIPKIDGDTLLYYTMAKTNIVSKNFYDVAQQLQIKYKDSLEIKKQFDSFFQHFADSTSVRKKLEQGYLSSLKKQDTLTEGQRELRRFNLENTKLLLGYVERLKKAKSASVATKVLKEYKLFLNSNSKKVNDLFIKYQFTSTVLPKEAQQTALTDFMSAVKSFEEAIRESKNKFGNDVLFNKAYSTVRSR